MQNVFVCYTSHCSQTWFTMTYKIYQVKRNKWRNMSKGKIKVISFIIVFWNCLVLVQGKEEVWWLKMWWFMLRVHSLKGEKINFDDSGSYNFFCCYLKNWFYLIGKVVSLLSKDLYEIHLLSWKETNFLDQHKVYQRLMEIKSLIPLSSNMVQMKIGDKFGSITDWKKYTNSNKNLHHRSAMQR